MDRRSFLISSLFSAIYPGVLLGAGDQLHQELFAACRKERDGRFSAAIFNLEKDIRVIELPARGHDLAVRPITNKNKALELVVFARRPGNFAISFSALKNTPPQTFQAKEGRHFFGHGVFSPNGQLLYTTENDFENARGVIGVRDADQNYQQIGEFLSGGIGPHDIAFLPDGRTLVVANGGIETHPDMGRKILNLASMEPSLAFIDRLSGKLLDRQILHKNLHQLSIRHLAVNQQGDVIFGCQYKGAKSDHPALMGITKLGEKPILMEAPKEAHQQMKNYVGSVSIDRSGRIAAASCPRGDMITYWDIKAHKFIGKQKIKDGCGLSMRRKETEFLLTSGDGIIASASSDTSPHLHQKRSNIMWDNHAVYLSSVIDSSR